MHSRAHAWFRVCRIMHDCWQSAWSKIVLLTIKNPQKKYIVYSRWSDLMFATYLIHKVSFVQPIFWVFNTSIKYNVFLCCCMYSSKMFPFFLHGLNWCESKILIFQRIYSTYRYILYFAKSGPYHFFRSMCRMLRLFVCVVDEWKRLAVPAAQERSAVSRAQRHPTRHAENSYWGKLTNNFSRSVYLINLFWFMAYFSKMSKKILSSWTGNYFCIDSELEIFLTRTKWLVIN